MKKLKLYLSAIIAIIAIQQASAQGSNPTFVNPGGTNTVNITPYFTGTDPDGFITHNRITAFPTYTTSVTVAGILYTSATFPAAGIIFPVGATVLLDPVDGAVSPVIPYKVIDNAGMESLNTALITITITGSATPDLTPTIDIDNLTFPVAEVPRDFVLNVYEINGGVAGNPISIKFNKLSAFTITYPTTSGLSNVYGGIANGNSNWTITENATTITATANSGVTIPANGSAILGFTIARKPGINNGTTQNLTATVTAFSGGETNVTNNKTIVSVSTSVD
jgi:hypothetical protein